MWCSGVFLLLSTLNITLTLRPQVHQLRAFSNAFSHLFLLLTSCLLGPCALRSVNATTYCDSNTILVEWEVTLDTPLYLVTAEADNQDLLSCNSTSNSCILQDVRCGMYYSIIVSASSNKCSSLRSPPKKIKTGIPQLTTVID